MSLLFCEHRVSVLIHLFIVEYINFTFYLCTIQRDLCLLQVNNFPFHAALTLNVPCTIDSSKHPVECVDPTVNLIPYAGFTVEEIEQLIKTFNISFSKKYQKELEMFLEDSRSCHQMTLYSLPFYYLVK